MMDKQRISVIIVSWNHAPLLESCLEALLGQGYPSLDVTVADNGSSDGSLDLIAARLNGVQPAQSPDNRGFSAAFNHVVSRTDGPFVLSLNPDVKLRPNFLSSLVDAASRHQRVGMVAPKLLRASDSRILDSTGLFMNRSRRPYDRGQGEFDRGQYDRDRFVFGACGAAALYRRSMLDDVLLGGEYFDEDFFTYCEDADLSWRAQLKGWRCAYEPQAVATHDRGWGDTLRKQGRVPKNSTGPRLAMRNRYLMTLKNDLPTHFLVDLPWILGSELPRLAYAALRRPGVLLALLDLIRMSPQALSKRKDIHNGRNVADTAVRRWFLAPGEMAAR
jgi:GT2 family glycosyltransferase